MRGRLPKYRLKDFHDEEIKGTFYQSELQKVDLRDDDMWNIEKILKTKGKGNQDEKVKRVVYHATISLTSRKGQQYAIFRAEE
jgi:hypothetical protein